MEILAANPSRTAMTLGTSRPLPSIEKLTQQIHTFPLRQILPWHSYLSSKLQLHSVLDGIMLDCRHGLNPAYRIVHSNCDGTGDIEFDFWGARRTWYYNTFNNIDGCEIEFQAQARAEQSFGDCPLPLWEATKVTDASPLLPNNHFYSNLSPTRRKQAIEEGRKELMEIIRNMPESSYELSLKDIVDKQHVEAVKEKAVSEDRSIHFATESSTKNQKKKKSKQRKAVPISRTGSMDADTFLIKMFFPTSLSFKKKSTAENSSKVSPSPSCEGSAKPIEKHWWIKRIFIRRNHKNREDKNNNGIDSSNSSTSRHASSSLPSCWLFFLSKKSRAKKQGDFII